MSTKEHCHGCGKLWSEESPDCVFNYHKKPEPQRTVQPKGNERKKCQYCGSYDLLPSEHCPSVIVCHNCDEVQQK